MIKSTISIKSRFFWFLRIETYIEILQEGEGFVWEHVQQIWSEETEIKDDSNWII